MELKNTNIDRLNLKSGFLIFVLNLIHLSRRKNVKNMKCSGKPVRFRRTVVSTSEKLKQLAKRYFWDCKTPLCPICPRKELWPWNLNF